LEVRRIHGVARGAQADLANANFRVRVIDVSSSTSRDFFLDWDAVRPTFTSGAPTTLNSIKLSPSTVLGGNPLTSVLGVHAAFSRRDKMRNLLRPM